MTEPMQPATEPIEEEVTGFFEQYKWRIIGGAAAVILGILGVGGIQIYRYQQKESARAAYATAESQEDFERIVSEFGGTVASNARLRLAALLRDSGQTKESDAVLQQVVEDEPDYELVSAAMLGLAANREAAGEIEEAISIYQQIPAKYDDSYAAPLARLQEGKLLMILGRDEQARTLFEDLSVTAAESPVGQQAANMLRFLRPPESSSTPAPAQVVETASEAVEMVE